MRRTYGWGSIGEPISIFSMIARCLALWRASPTNSVFVQFLILIASLAAPSRLLRLQQYIFATALALVVTLAVFTFVPAGGIVYSISRYRTERVREPIAGDEHRSNHIPRCNTLRRAHARRVAWRASLPSRAFTLHGRFCLYGDFIQSGDCDMVRSSLNLFMLVITPIQGAHYFHRPRRRCSRRGGRNLCRREIYARS